MFLETVDGRNSRTKLHDASAGWRRPCAAWACHHIALHRTTSRGQIDVYPDYIRKCRHPDIKPSPPRSPGSQKPGPPKVQHIQPSLPSQPSQRPPNFNVVAALFRFVCQREARTSRGAARDSGTSHPSFQQHPLVRKKKSNSMAPRLCQAAWLLWH